MQNLEVDLGHFQQFLFDLAGEDASEAILDSFVQQFTPLYAHLNIIKNGTNRIKGIVEDLSAFTQLDCTEQQTVQLSGLLQSTINLVQTKYLETTEFITDFAVIPPLACYPAQLNQVFMNLIVNGCEAINAEQSTDQYPGQNQPKGKITIACRPYFKQGNQQQIEISITDNGCGMSDETKARLFDPFYTTKSVGEGTGLGLSIAFGIVQKHDGEFTVESELGVGSTLVVRLPIR